jgi:hypothetical protein
MALIDTFLLDPAKFNIWMAVRNDRIFGSGTAQDPYNGAARQDPPSLRSYGGTGWRIP